MAFQAARCNEALQKLRALSQRKGWALNITELAPPSHRQIKILPQLLFKEVILPLLQSQQMHPD
eukprot:6982160-Karenia_brevis.AAC.1